MPRFGVRCAAQDLGVRKLQADDVSTCLVACSHDCSVRVEPAHRDDGPGLCCGVDLFACRRRIMADHCSGPQPSRGPSQPPLFQPTCSMLACRSSSLPSICAPFFFVAVPTTFHNFFLQVMRLVVLPALRSTAALSLPPPVLVGSLAFPMVAGLLQPPAGHVGQSHGRAGQLPPAQQQLLDELRGCAVLVTQRGAVRACGGAATEALTAGPAGGAGPQAHGLSSGSETQAEGKGSGRGGEGAPEPVLLLLPPCLGSPVDVAKDLPSAAHRWEGGWFCVSGPASNL